MTPGLGEVADFEPLPDGDRHLRPVLVFEDVVGHRPPGRPTFDPHLCADQSMGEDDILDVGSDRDPDRSCARRSKVDVARRSIPFRGADPEWDPPQDAVASFGLSSSRRVQPGATRPVLRRIEHLGACGAPRGEVDWRVRAGAGF